MKFGEHVARAAMDMDNEMMKSEFFGLEPPGTMHLLKDGIVALVSIPLLTHFYDMNVMEEST